MLHWFRTEAQIVVRLLAHPLLWLLLALTLGGAVAAYQVRHGYTIDVGSAADQAYVHNFHDRRSTPPDPRTFRWSDAYGYVILPGVGGGAPFTVQLTLDTGRADVPVTVIVNGDTLFQQPVAAGRQTLTLPVDATHPRALDSRDLVIEVRAPGRADPDVPGQTQGLMLDEVVIAPPGAGFITPAYSQLAYLAAIVILVYLLIGRAWYPLDQVDRRRDPLPRPWLPLLGATGVGAILVGLLAAVHLPLTVATGQLAAAGGGTYASTYLLLIGAEPLARRLAPQTRRGARLAAVLFAGAFLVRFGPMALPQTVIIDLPWHMKWMRELLLGHWESLYFPGALSSVPAEWGLAVLIPKSPLFYFVAAPLAVLPWNLEVSVKGFVCLLEASTVLFCYGLPARFAPGLGGWRAGLWAGLAYALTPLGYRALAYGILPTILAQWLTLACFTALLVWADRTQTAPQGNQSLGQIARGGLLLLLLALSLVAFPTIAVFNTLVAGLLALAWLRRPRLGFTVAGLLVAAWAVAMVSYYGIYVSEFLNTTLPALLEPTAAAAQGAATAPAPNTVRWTGPLNLLRWTFDYIVSPIPLLAGLAGLGVLWFGGARATAGRAGQQERRLATLTAAWIVILPLFLVVNYRVDMIGKHLFYTMVPLALGSGLFLWQLARRGGPARLLAVLLAGALAWTALTFWVARLVQAST